MRKLLPLLGLLLWAMPANATIALVATCHNIKGGNSGAQTTTATNCTGATLLIAHATSKYIAGNSFTITDSTGANTWTPLTKQQSTSAATNELQIFYAVNPTVSGTQTFTITPVTGTFPQIVVQGFSGTLTTAGVFDAESPGGGTTCVTVTTCQPGSITPAGTGELFVTSLANNNAANTFTINSSFTITDADTTGTFENISAAYLVVAGGGAQNPTWSLTSDSVNVVMAAFKPPAGAATAASTLVGPSKTVGPSRAD